MGEYLNFANSWVVFAICAVPIAIVVFQSIYFIRLARKQAVELGMEKTSVKKVMTNSAVFSILPSLPIVITLAALMPVLGKYIPWLRLTVIGSAMYESMCADLVITSFGYAGLGDTSITLEVWVAVVWVMSAVACAWPLCNVLGLRAYDKGVKKVSTAFIGIFASSLFIGLIAITGVPKLLNFADPTCIVVTVVSGLAVLLLDSLAKKLGKRALSEFSFPLAMVAGMAAAVIIN